MNRAPRLTGGEILRALQRGGFHLVRIRGSHHYLRNPNLPELVTVPVHPGRTIPQKTLQSILHQAGLTMEELVELL